MTSCPCNAVEPLNPHATKPAFWTPSKGLPWGYRQKPFLCFSEPQKAACCELFLVGEVTEKGYRRGIEGMRAEFCGARLMIPA